MPATPTRNIDQYLPARNVPDTSQYEINFLLVVLGAAIRGVNVFAELIVKLVSHRLDRSVSEFASANDFRGAAPSRDTSRIEPANVDGCSDNVKLVCVSCRYFYLMTVLTFHDGSTVKLPMEGWWSV